MKNRIALFAILFIASTTFHPIFSQTQMGDDIDAEEAGEGAGSSVSLSSDGTRLAIGGVFADAQGISPVRVYEWDGGSWLQMGDDIQGDYGFDVPGFSVSLSSDGSRVALGSPGTHGLGTEIGHVRMYEWDGGSWTQMGDEIDGEADLDVSGMSVSLSSDGNRVAIGAPGNDENGSNAGHVRVYEWNGGNWAQMGDDIDGEVAYEYSGRSVSLSSDGTRVAIGAPEIVGNSEIGLVRVYEWDGGSWTQIGDEIEGEAEEDNSGSSVSLSSDGNRVAIGAPRNDENGNNAGHVRVYEWNGGSWTQMGDDIDGEAAEDLSGWSVSLSSDGNRVAIGAPEIFGNPEEGYVRVYEWSGESWTQTGDEIEGEAEEDNSGRSVSLSSDGNRVAIGAPRNDENGNNAGHVRVYEFTSVSTITLAEKAIIDIFPNPTSGTIELLGVEYETINIIDNLGRIILKVEQSGTEIDVSTLVSGIYFIQINSDDQWITKKLIKK